MDDVVRDNISIHCTSIMSITFLKGKEMLRNATAAAETWRWHWWNVELAWGKMNYNKYEIFYGRTGKSKMSIMSSSPSQNVPAALANNVDAVAFTPNINCSDSKEQNPIDTKTHISREAPGVCFVQLNETHDEMTIWKRKSESNVGGIKTTTNYFSVNYVCPSSRTLKYCI